MIQFRAQVGTNKAWIITLHKTVKYCIYYKRDYHTENEYHDKYLHLNKAKMATTKPGTKQRQNRKPVKDEPADRNPNKSSYFI